MTIDYERTRGFAYIETVGFSLLNPKACLKFSGTPEQVKELIRYIDPILFKEEYGEEAVDVDSKEPAGSKT